MQLNGLGIRVMMSARSIVVWCGLFFSTLSRLGAHESGGYRYTCTAILQALRAPQEARKVLIPGLLLRTPVVHAIRKAHGLSLIESFELGGILVEVPDGFSEVQLHRLAVDLTFNAQAPDADIHNSTLWLSDFDVTKSDSANALDYAKTLASWNESASLGLFLWGNGGVGKSLLGIAAAKEAMLKNPDLNVAYITKSLLERVGDPKALLERLKQAHFFVLDDIHNLTEVKYWTYFFLPFIAWAQETGGIRIVATSNHDPEKMIEAYFYNDAHRQLEETKLMGRWRNLMISIEMRGPSARPSALDLVNAKMAKGEKP